MSQVNKIDRLHLFQPAWCKQHNANSLSQLQPGNRAGGLGPRRLSRPQARRCRFFSNTGAAAGRPPPDPGRRTHRRSRVALPALQAVRARAGAEPGPAGVTPLAALRCYARPGAPLACLGAPPARPSACSELSKEKLAAAAWGNGKVSCSLLRPGGGRSLGAPRQESGLLRVGHRLVRHS